VRHRIKLWLEQEGQQVFGDGLYHLLTLIHRYGSIRQAAEDMKMSYRHAWGTVKKAEERLGVTLLHKKTGGESGGGARLTPEAEDLIFKYREFRHQVEKFAAERFAEYFDR